MQNIINAHIINLDEYESIENHWIAWYAHGNNIIYFVSFEIEDIPKKNKKIIRNKNIINIYIIQVYNLIMY